MPFLNNFNGLRALENSASRNKSDRGDVRRLSSEHFAFMRAILQGIDPVASWNRYLISHEGSATVDKIKRLTQHIKDAWTVASKHRRPPIKLAPFLKFQRSSTVAEPNLPLLEDFVTAHNLESFSEIEQLQWFRQQYGHQQLCSSASARHITHQLAALDWLQRHHYRHTPNKKDLISAWLNPQLATHLANVNLLYFHELIAHIHQTGLRWSMKIPGIGVAKAKRIIDWLHIYDEVLSASQPAITILPLENWLLARESFQDDGSVHNPDAEAIRSWLDTKQPTLLIPELTELHGTPAREQKILEIFSNTQRAYWKEVQRFCLWLFLVKHTTLLKIDQTGCSQYLAFLKHLPEDWCATRGRGKSQHLWRPFEKSLSQAAQYRALKVLRGLYAFLVGRGDIAQNPWDELVDCSAPKSVSARKQEKRRFDQIAWKIIHQELATMPATSVNLRLKVAIALLHTTAAGIGKIIQACPTDLCLNSKLVNHGARLSKAVITSRLLEVSPDTICLLQSYFVSRGLSPDLSTSGNANVALLGRASDAMVRAPWVPSAQAPFDPRAGIGAGTLRDQLKQFFLACASRCQDKPEIAAQFAVATSHWLRREPLSTIPT